MEDTRVWEFEESLWTGDAAHYRESIDDACLMVVPQPPYAMSGEQAIAAVQDTPRWSRVELTEKLVARPQEGLIVIAYRARAERDGPDDGRDDAAQGYEAWCTSTYRRLAHDDWRVIQHHQTPPLTATAAT